MAKKRLFAPVAAALMLSVALGVAPAFADEGVTSAANDLGTDLVAVALSDGDKPSDSIDDSGVVVPMGGEAMWRLYNPNSGEHFYTAKKDERNNLVDLGWVYEGVGWFAPQTSGTPVYRLYNKFGGEHHYTTNASERNSLVSQGWKDEGIGWYSVDSGPGKGLFRDYNPNAYANNHNYTLSSDEHAALVNYGWSAEGAAWLGMPDDGALADGWYCESGVWRYYQSGSPVAGTWVVTSSSPACTMGFVGMQRYWIDANGELAIERLIDPSTAPDAAAGYLAYATNGAAVVISKYDNGTGRVYVADGDGRLETAVGWLVTDKYDGQLERYYFDGTMHAAMTSMFTVDGNSYFGLGGVGYVARSQYVNVGGSWKWADGDTGVLSDASQVNRLLSMAQEYYSPSRYLLMVDIDDPKLVIFEGSRYAWNVIRICDCCTGAPWSPTVTGVFSIGSKGYSFGEDHGYSCYYYSQFYGDYLFHTRKYYPGTHILQDSSIGVRCSAGCVRLYDEDALWIQDNCPAGTTVVCVE